MIPETDIDLLEAEPVPGDIAPVTVMGPIEEARMFEEYLDDDDGDEDYNDEDLYVEEIVAEDEVEVEVEEEEEDPLDPLSYGDLMLLVYHAIFQ